MRGLAAGIVQDEEIAAHFSTKAEIGAMLVFERELAAVQADLGIIPGEAALAIARAADAFEADGGAIAEGMLRDGVPVPALVKALRESVGEPHAVHLHHGATSQDAVDTGLMLRMRPVLQALAARCETVVLALDTLTRREGRRPLMAQTRMQAALPFTVDAKIATWMRPLADHRARLRDLDDQLQVQLGGPVGDGASFGPVYRRLREALALRLGLMDAEPWHSDRTLILDLAQGLALVTGTLGKIGQDVALLAQSDRGAVRIEGAGGSSAMAHKQNPVAAELLVALARLNAGALGTLAQSLVHENERSGAAWTLEWLVLPQMAETAGAALRHAEGLAANLSFGAG